MPLCGLNLPFMFCARPPYDRNVGRFVSVRSQLTVATATRVYLMGVGDANITLA